MSGSKNRFIGLVLIALAAHCVFLTQSKGAFLACAGGLTMLMLFKRPIWLQIVVLVAFYAVGLAVMKSLPRMDTLSKSDEGIQGRMIVWQQAKASMESTGTGEGLKAFHGYVAVRVPKIHRTINIPIATHGSYVRHGADLGYIGLMLFAGIFYAGARLLIQAGTEPDGVARRVQRTLYALVITTAISCWVVDRAYHMDYFLLTGVLSAFHRRFRPPETISEGEGGGHLPAAPGLALPFTAAGTAPIEAKVATAAVHKDARIVAVARPPAANGEDPEPDEHGAIKLKWDRIGVVDLVMMYMVLRVVLYYWELFSTDFVVF
jgi:hypothetical protein